MHKRRLNKYNLLITSLKLDKITLFVTVQMLHPQHYLGEAKNIYIIFL